MSDSDSHESYLVYILQNYILSSLTLAEQEVIYCLYGMKVLISETKDQSLYYYSVKQVKLSFKFGQHLPDINQVIKFRLKITGMRIFQ